MNSKEKRKLRRKFCIKSGIVYTFDTEQQGLDYLAKAKTRWDKEQTIFIEPTGQIIPCSICGCWHFLRAYKENDYKIYQFPNLEERAVLLEPVPMKADYSYKRTKKKMIGRNKNVRTLALPTKIFGYVPDNGWFTYIVSSRAVCFNCEKSWRNFNRKADRRKMTYEDNMKNFNVCPHCGNVLQRVPPMFRSPKKGDKKQWNHLRKLYKVKER